MRNYYRILSGHLQRLVHDFSGGRQITPSDNPPETAWIHCCEADHCGRYVAASNPFLSYRAAK